MLWQIILVLIIVWALVMRWKQRKLIEVSKTLSSTKYRYLPFVGHGISFLGTDEDRMTAFQTVGREAISNKDGVSTLWQGPRFYIVTADANIAEFILKNCLAKDDILKFMRKLTGNGSIYAPVSIWRRRRKAVAPTFSPKNLMQFVTTFAQQSQIMVNQLKSAAGKGEFSIWNYLNTYSMDAICENALGVSINFQKQRDQPFLESFDEISELFATRLVQPWFHNDKVYSLTPAYKRMTKCIDIIFTFIDQIIKEKKSTMEQDSKSTTDANQLNKNEGLKTFLQLLIDSSGGDNNGFTDLELREETLVMVIAATDTSATGVGYASVLLSRHQDVQEKLYEELKEVFGNSNRLVTAEDLTRLKYLEAVIKETLRLYPPVPIIARKVEKDITLPSGIKFVKDCGVIINIWALHRNPKYWGDDAEEFRPERFLDTPLKHPAAFMPFSHGPRSCIGMQYAMMSMKSALATLLRNYKILPATDTYDVNKPLRVKYDIMMKDVNNFTVQLESRN